MAQDNTKVKIEELYGKFLSGEISKKEYDELFDLLRDEAHQEWIGTIIDHTMAPHIQPVGTKQERAWTSQPAATFSKATTPKKKTWYRIAAAAAVFVCLLGYFFFFPASSDAWIVVTTGYQQTQTVELPDGSTVVLNANSELKWKEDLEKAEIRLVEFRGEGFFDITHLEDRPFKVHTSNVDVNVLGTAFNLETRRDYTNVFLKEGKVVLETRKSESVEMEPGDLVHYNTERNEVRKVRDQDSESAMSWKEGVFTFIDLTGVQILEKMEDIYGKEFVFDNPTELMDVIVVQGLPYTDWDFTREALELALDVQLVDSVDNIILVKEK